MVIIDGFSLYQSLRACRNQLARGESDSLTQWVAERVDSWLIYFLTLWTDHLYLVTHSFTYIVLTRCRLILWLDDWSTDLLTDVTWVFWLHDWLIDAENYCQWLFYWLNDYLIDSIMNCGIKAMTDSMTHLMGYLIDWMMGCHVNAMTDWLTYLMDCPIDFLSQ